MKKIALFSVAVLLIVAFTSIVKPNNEEEYKEIKRSTLRGLQGVEVFVIGPAEEVKQYGLTKSQITTDVELKLRQAGIKILSSKERLRTPGAPLFTIWAQIEKNPYLDLFLISIRAELQQFVLLERDPTVSCLATTWETWPIHGLIPPRSLGDFRQKISDQVDEFINDYLAANRKDQPTKEMDKKP